MDNDFFNEMDINDKVEKIQNPTYKKGKTIYNILIKMMSVYIARPGFNVYTVYHWSGVFIIRLNEN